MCVDLDIVYCCYCEYFAGLANLDNPEKSKVPFFIHPGKNENCFLCEKCNEEIGKGNYCLIKFSYPRW